MKTAQRKGYIALQDISYASDKKTSNSLAYQETKHLLDLYLPCIDSSETGVQNVIDRSRKSIENESTTVVDDDCRCKERPVVLFVHGGGWKRGDRRGWDHYLYYDVNFMAALFFWFHNFHRNVGETFARRGVPCLLMSYPLTRLEFPWIIFELITSYVGSVIFLGIVLGIALFPWLLNNWTNCCNPVIFYLIPELAEESSNCRLFVAKIFAILLLISNIVILTFISIKQVKLGLSKSIIVLVWLCILSSMFIETEMSRGTNMLLFFSLTFLLSQGLLLFRILSHPLLNYHDQASNVAKCVNWARHFGLTSGLYGTDKLFLMGHSAGGHLVSLTTLNNQYLRNEGLSTSDVKGVISVSGVYDLLNLNRGIMKFAYLYPTFGSDPEVWREASPLHRLKDNHLSLVPPFLILCAEKDLHLRGESKAFHQSLRDAGVSCERYLIGKTNHISILYHLERNIDNDNSVIEHCLKFIESTLKGHKTKSLNH